MIMSPLVGIHPVREALLAGRPLDRVVVAKGAGGTIVVQSNPKMTEGYRPLLVEVVKFFESKEPPVSNEETLELSLDCRLDRVVLSRCVRRFSST